MGAPKAPGRFLGVRGPSSPTAPLSPLRCRGWKTWVGTRSGRGPADPFPHGLRLPGSLIQLRVTSSRAASQPAPKRLTISRGILIRVKPFILLWGPRPPSVLRPQIPAGCRVTQPLGCDGMGMGSARGPPAALRAWGPMVLGGPRQEVRLGSPSGGQLGTGHGDRPAATQGTWGRAGTPGPQHPARAAHRHRATAASFPPPSPPQLRCQRGGELLFPKIGPGDCLPHDFFMAGWGGEYGGGPPAAALGYPSCPVRCN